MTERVCMDCGKPLERASAVVCGQCVLDGKDDLYVEVAIRGGAILMADTMRTDVHFVLPAVPEVGSEWTITGNIGGGFGWRVIGVREDVATTHDDLPVHQVRLRPGAIKLPEPKTCPDGGRCHHDCDDVSGGACWRVFNASPLDADAWSDEIVTAEWRKMTAPRPERPEIEPNIVLGEN